jgi:spore germination cell wall hydrolase CwlJ-like protein
MEAWKNCLKIASELLNGKPDPTNNALHFLTKNLNTYWSKKLKLRKVIGNHKFLGN